MESTAHRLETFSDGVFAIALTLLIIEIKIPATESVHTRQELWQAFLMGWPSWLAFLVSFITILISWVAHAHGLKLLAKVNNKLIYANGLLLLTIVVIPFFTAALAEYIRSDLVQPAVTLYCAVALLNNFAWILIQHVCLNPESLYKAGINLKKIKKSYTYVHYGFGLYTFTFILSFWFPISAFVLITSSYLLWLMLGINLKEENMMV